MVFLAEAGPGAGSQLCWCWKRQQRAARHGPKHRSVQERSSHELHKHLLERFTKGNMENPTKFPLLSKTQQLGMSSAADVTQEQFLLLLFQQGEGGGRLPL